MKLIVEMEMPKVCMTSYGYYGNCPMDRIWCAQRNAPSGTKMGDAFAEMTDNIPSWCPICGVLPEEHGDLIDRETAKNAFDSSFLTFRMKDGETMRGFYQRTIDELPAVIAAERKDDEQIH